MSASKLNIMSQRPRDIGPKILSGSRRRPKAKAKTSWTRKRKGASEKYFNHWVDIL